MSTTSVRANEFCKVAVTREQHTQVDPTKDKDGQVTGVNIQKWLAIKLYINQKEVGSYTHKDKPDVGSNSQPLEIGRSYVGNDMGTSQIIPFAGIISEVRLWSAARKSADIGREIKGSESGLVSWWQFTENAGNIATDAKSTNHATLKSGCQWAKDPSPQASPLTLYANGEPLQTEDYPAPGTEGGSPQFTLGAVVRNQQPTDCFKGLIEETRIWKVARTQEQITDNLFTRLLGDRDDLIAYYTFDAESKTEIKDQSLRGQHLTLVNCPDPMNTFALSTAPISSDIAQVRSALAGVKTAFQDVIHSQPGVQEYGDLEVDSAGNLVGVLKRCYSYIKDQQWHLLTGFKVGSLVTEWIGQVQTDPQLIGFIEGAPPVPSENLTARSAALGQDYAGASKIELTQAQSTTYTYSSSKDKGFDMSVATSAQVGFKSHTDAGLGLATSLEESDVQVGVAASFENSRGWLDDASTGTGKTTSKVSSMTMQGFWENEAQYADLGKRFVPLNVGFALVQSETADIFALRLRHNNALVSYQMRPNPDIPKDWNIITFPINPRYTKQGVLDGKVGNDVDPNYPNAKTYSPNISYFKPIEAYSLKQAIQREEEELQAYFDQFDAGDRGRSEKDPSLPNLAKRNLVNTYVWTADGGLFAESNETMDVQQEVTGGSYSFTGMAGLTLSAEIAISKAAVGFELQAMFGGHRNLTVTKSKDSETSFGMNVELDVEGDLSLQDADGNLIMDLSDQLNPQPKKKPGKVDAYRFMSFYLEPRNSNFDEFFNKVVDPIWLSQGQHPNAIALRQAQQTDKKPPCWRVMHRVTFVSRVLPEFEKTTNLPALEKAMVASDIDSNYELIKKLEPFIRHNTQSWEELKAAVEGAISLYLPALAPHSEMVVQLMANYLGVIKR